MTPLHPLENCLRCRPEILNRISEIFKAWEEQERYVMVSKEAPITDKSVEINGD